MKRNIFSQDNVKSISNFLETYSGRDKVLRILYYGTKCISGSGFCSDSTNSKLIIFADNINDCRTFLRLFDDLPMLSYTLSYGLGEDEPDSLMQVCGVAVNIFDQLYYPLEHIAWAADCRLLSIKSDRWWTASTMCWAFSIYFSLCKSLRYFSVLQTSKECKKLTSADSRLAMKQISRLQFNELLTMTRCVADLVHAVHWLPKGFLWSGQLKDWHIGALGTVSSIITLYQTFAHSDDVK